MFHLYGVSVKVTGYRVAAAGGKYRSSSFEYFHFYAASYLIASFFFSSGYFSIRYCHWKKNILLLTMNIFAI